MSFPTTSVLDDFNRANQGPPPSGSWIDMSGAPGGLEVVGNQCSGEVGSVSVGLWDDSAIGPDCEVFCTIAVKHNGEEIGLYARLTTASVTTVDGYSLAYNMESGTDTLRVFRVDNGVGTQLGATINQEVGAGDRIGLSIVGSTLTIYHDSGSGFTSLGTRSDGTYTATGRIGAYIWNTTARIDDFGGGDYVPATAVTDLDRGAGRGVLRGIGRGV